MLKRMIQQYFTERAKHRDSDFESCPTLGYEQKRRQRVVFEFLKPVVGEKALDVGCGTAKDILVFGKRGIFGVGVDLNTEMIREAKFKCKESNVGSITLIIADATNLPFRNQTFDKIVCSETLEHILKWKAAVKEISRVLTTSGTAVISTPNTSSLAGMYRRLHEFFKEWWHPFDEWKNYKMLEEALRNYGLMVIGCAAAVLIPDLILRWMPFSEKVLPLIESIENKLYRKKPFKYLGYMLVLKVKLGDRRLTVC